MGGRRKRFAFTIFALGLSAALALATAELLVRMSGWGPWRSIVVHATEPVMFEPDARLGWKAKEGSHVAGPYAPGFPPVRLTFLADGRRATGARAGGGRQKLLFIGCSMTQGWAISDEETFTWRIQERFPELQVLNYGTSAYGTYQSLLVLERVLAEPDPPRVIVYSLMEEHEIRNIAHPLWLRLLATYSRRGVVSPPYCTLDSAGALQRHPPETYPSWPLREYLASVAFLQDVYVRARARNRAAQGRAVTERLLIEMNDRARSTGALLYVVLLHFTDEVKAHYARFLAEHGIRSVDCAYPITGALQVPGEGHPNGVMNARWADCIAAGTGLSTASR